MICNLNLFFADGSCNCPICKGTANGNRTAARFSAGKHATGSHMRLRSINYTTKLICMAALLVAASVCAISADNGRQVQELLKQRLDAVLVVLQDEKLSLEAKKEKISTIVSPMFDFPLMAKLTLGRKHWPSMTRQQQDKFTTLFVDLLRKTYLDRISSYSDEQVVIKNTAEVNQKVHVLTDLISKGENISMLYKFYRTGNGWKIYDLEVEGVSLIVSYRNQFDQILSNGTVNDLIEQLENQEKT